MPVRIAHLSDLHFGMKGHTTVWISLSDYLRNTLKPDLILVTGDIVDTPDADLYKDAVAQLDLLRVNGSKCYVCAGNHDRHVQGNAISGLPPWSQGVAGWIRRLFRWRAPSDDNRRTATRGASEVDSLFDKEFGRSGMLLQLQSPADIEVLSRGIKWKLRLVGLDSSADAQFFAQGHISPKVMQQLRTALCGSTDPDLVITLVHHHLLPVMKGEKSEQTLEVAMSGTTVLNNAGSVLEALARGEADLVLHGHEHARHIAKYSSFEARRGDVIVVGAGSATGAHTVNGCDITRASFNLLELTDDSSVVLREVRNTGPGWEIRRDDTMLMSAREIRRSRYFRRSPNAALPESRWIRHFEFTQSRDCRIRESLSNWILDEPLWIATTTNTTGKPYFVEGEVELSQGRIEPLSNNQPLKSLGAGQYELRHKLSIQGAAPFFVRRIDQEILWVGGAMLSEDDLTRGDAGPYRSDKREFIAARVQNGVQSLTLSLELPGRFRPQNDAFEVVAETPDGKSHRPKELQDRLVITGHGKAKVRATLTIPYPQPGVRYVVCWPLPVIAPVTSELELARENLAALANDVISKMNKALQTIFPNEQYSIALYVPEIFHEKLSFKMLSSNEASPIPPKRVTPTANQNPFCIAHWGVPNCFSAAIPGNPDQDEKAGGIVDGEAAIFSIPVVSSVYAGFTPSSEESLAILRVGWLSGTVGGTLLSKVATCGNIATRGILPL